jgi:cell division protein YceG involved in septum cleavage
MICKIKAFIKKYKVAIIIILIIGLLIGGFFLFYKKVPKQELDKTELQNEFKRTKALNDSLQLLVTQMRQNTEIFNEEIIITNAQIQAINEDLKKLSETFNKKISVVDTFNSIDILRFYSDRYGKKGQ